MCSGQDHGELEWRMTPVASILAKAALAAANFLSKRGLTLQWMGAVSAVSTVWKTLEAGVGWLKGLYPVMLRNFSSRRQWILLMEKSPLELRTWRLQGSIRCWSLCW